MLFQDLSHIDDLRLESKESLPQMRSTINLMVKQRKPILVCLSIKFLKRGLQLTLNEVEVLLLVLAFKVVPDGVGVGNGTTSRHDKLCNIEQELKVHQIISWIRNDHISSLLFELLYCFLGEANRFLMLLIPCLEMVQPLQVVLYLGRIIHLLNLLFAGAFKSITFGSAATRPRMRVILIISQTDPAELVLAL